MADLIIKAGTGTGNRVLLQDQAGGNILTSGNSGATIANADFAASTTFPVGHVVQVLHSYVDSQLSTQVVASGDNWATFSQLTIAITPKAGNKVLCQYHVHLGNTGQSDAQPVTAMFRDSTKIGVGAADGVKIRVSTGKVGPLASESAGNFTTHSSIWLDDPNADGSTSFDYKVGIAARGTGSSGTVYTSRTGTDSDNTETQRTSSSIVVMEIAQ